MKHSLEYAKSSRAKCHGGPPSCNGLPIAKGELRHGTHIPDPRSYEREMVQWRHWGCVPRNYLDSMGTKGVERVEGFRSLSPEDQAKVRKAVSERKIDPKDYPSAAPEPPLPSSSQPSTSTATQVGQKRKRTAGEAGPSSSQPSSSTVVAGSSQQPIVLADDEDDDEEEQADEVYVSTNTQVVGIQYYTGLVDRGEQVLLIREPSNQYDRNAIQVRNIAGTQVGHIPRDIAARLARLMDGGYITVEGTMLDGNLDNMGRSSGRKYSLKLQLNICGPSDPARRAQIEPLLIWATPGQRGFNPPSSQTGVVGTSLSPKKKQAAVAPSRQALGMPAQPDPYLTKEKAEELQRVLEGFKRVNDEGRRESLLDDLCSEQDILKLPEYENAPSKATGELTTNLLKHQSQALRWCYDQEHPERKLPKKPEDKPVQFWQLRLGAGNQSFWYNLATNTPQKEAPPLGKGGIMADAMGLGKTLTMLALIIATKDEPAPGFNKSTLIVVPLSVVSNWESQIAEHVKPGLLSHHVYHGAGRDVSADKLSKFDVVITTYQTVASDAQGKSKKGGLFNVKWKRIILDEGHTVRNPKAQMTQAVHALEGQCRWVVSGTPIINTITDLGTILSFLKICKPLDQPDFFKRLLVRPLTQGSPTAVDLLKALMNSVCIRRTKEMQDENGQPLVPLPPVDIIVVKVNLDDKTRELYDAIEAESRRRFNETRMGGNPNVTPVNVLSMLTRLRQLTIHPSLVPPNYLEDLRAGGSEIPMDRPAAIQLTAEDKERLQAALAKAIEDSEECPICFDVLKEPRITSCSHCFCLDCITTVIQRSPSCPMDRRPISVRDLIEPAPIALDNIGTLANGSDDSTPPSVKTSQLIHLLKLLPPGDKSLVFSQFTTYLDKIALALEDEDIPFVRFDGSMSPSKRQDVLKEFSKPVNSVAEDSGSEYEDRPRKRAKGKAVSKNKKRGRNPVVMLISLKAGALGLNLTVANNVFLMDPWWQESIESQAIDRVNRIGQTKPVTVYQMIADNTIESKVLEIQERKKSLIKQAFAGTKNNESARAKREARMNELVELLGGGARVRA